MAIDDLLDEHEQGERVLSWLRRNGVGLIGGVVLGLALIGGWQWWQGQQAGKRMQAGDDYQAVLKSIAGRNLKQAVSRASAIKDESYSALASLDIAKAQVQGGQADAALATLQKTKTSEPELQRVIDQRTARLLIDAKKPAEALKLLSAATDAASLEVRGDAQSALGKREEARKAYGAALTALDVDAPRRRLLELKLTEAGGTPSTPGARAS